MALIDIKYSLDDDNVSELTAREDGDMFDYFLVELPPEIQILSRLGHNVVITLEDENGDYVADDAVEDGATVAKIVFID